MLRQLRSLAALAIVGGLVLGVAGTAAADPKVPDGCTFAKGVLSCVTTSSSSKTLGPISTTDYVTPSTTFGGVTAQQICDFQFPPPGQRTGVKFTDLTLDVIVTTTTTSERHGLNGKVFNSSSVDSARITRAIMLSPAVAAEPTCRRARSPGAAAESARSTSGSARRRASLITELAWSTTHTTRGHEHGD